MISEPYKCEIKTFQCKIAAYLCVNNRDSQSQSSIPSRDLVLANHRTVLGHVTICMNNVGPVVPHNHLVSKAHMAQPAPSCRT